MVASRKKLRAQADAGAVSEEDLQTLLAARRSKERKTKVSKRKEQQQEKDAGEEHINGEENVDASASNGKKAKKKKQPKNANESEAVDVDADIPKMKKQKKRKKESLEHKSPEPAQQNGADETEIKGDVEETEGGNGVKTSKKKKKGIKKTKVDRWGAQVIEAPPPDVQDEDHGNAVQDEDHGNVNQVEEEQYEPKKIYVGGMPYTTTEDDIHNYFAECGAIEELDCTIFPDTGKFRGLAFITFKTEAAARKALELDGADMGGRFLTIQKCKVKPQESTKPKVYSEPPPKTEGCTSVYIGNLSWDITQEDLKRFFKKCKVKEIRLALDKESGEFKGYGHVDFENEESLERAVKLDQKQVLGRPIKIAYAVPKKLDNSALRQQDSKSGKSKSCFSCGEEGHVSFNCPKKVQA